MGPFRINAQYLHVTGVPAALRVRAHPQRGGAAADGLLGPGQVAGRVLRRDQPAFAGARLSSWR